MVTTEDILEKLRAGASLDSIGDEIANKMNEAKALYEKEELERNQKEDKFNAVNKAADATIDCFKKYYPTLYKEFFNENNVDSSQFTQNIINVLDFSEELYKTPNIKEVMLGLGNNLFSATDKFQKANKKRLVDSDTGFFDTLSSFLED